MFQCTRHSLLVPLRTMIKYTRALTIAHFKYLHNLHVLPWGLYYDQVYFLFTLCVSCSFIVTIEHLYNFLHEITSNTGHDNVRLYYDFVMEQNFLIFSYSQSLQTAVYSHTLTK